MKGRKFLDESIIMKIRNYFSERIEEIKQGTYVPTYEQIKGLPEFSGINRETFRVARSGWFRENFHMNVYKFSSRVKSGLSPKDYDRKVRMKKVIIGVIILILGLLSIILAIFIQVITSGYGDMWVIPFVIAIILIGIGLLLILFNSFKTSK